MSARLHALRRTLVACAVLFAVLLTFLSLQMLRGRDPSMRTTAQARTSAPASAPKADDGSLISSIVGFAASALSEGDDEHDGGGSSVTTKTS